ncbi:hypothetical protein F4808DRAFT_472190 [Astrocystis sublimbata]|nr:hypothetical protein F4808DRAFT_472190 [Astrocystis sublimbata]
MADEQPHHPANLELGAPSSPPRTRVPNTAAHGGSSTGLSTTSSPGSHDQDKQNEPPQAHTPEKEIDTNVIVQSLGLRPSVGPRKLSTDLIDEIRKVIRQEFLGTYVPETQASKPVSDNGGVSPTDTVPIHSGLKKGPETTVKSPHGGSKDRSYSPDSDSPRSSAARTPTLTTSPSSTASAPRLTVITPLSAVKHEHPRHGVRFSDDVTLVDDPLNGPTSAPAKAAPWFKHRHASSGGEPVREWGVLFDGNGFATARLDQVLKRLAICLAEEIPPRGGVVVTPEKLGLLYSRFRVEGDVHPFRDIFHVLQRRDMSEDFTSTSDRSTAYYDRLSDFFADLDCEYYLVPPSTNETALLTKSPSVLSMQSYPSSMMASPSSPLFPRSTSYSNLSPAATQKQSFVYPPQRYHRPCLPALTPAGFAQFITICILAHPDIEARRMDKMAGELQLFENLLCDTALVGPGNATSSQHSITHSPAAYLPDILGSNGNGNSASQGDRPQRQSVRGLFPVRSDAKSRKLLAAAMEDLLCDLDLVPSSPASSFPPSEQLRRWSLAYEPTSPTLKTEADYGTSGLHLPPPPVPLPRETSDGRPAASKGNGSGSSGESPLKPLQSSLSEGALAGGFRDGLDYDPSSLLRTSPSRPQYQHHSRHSYHQDHRQYGPAEVIVQPQRPQPSQLSSSSTTVVAPRPRNRRTHFELGNDEDTDGDSSSSESVTTVATVTPRPARTDRRRSYHGHEHERDRDRERQGDRRRGRDHDKGMEQNKQVMSPRDREREHDRAKGHDRRPGPAPRRSSEHKHERRRSGGGVLTIDRTATSGVRPSSPKIARSESHGNIVARDVVDERGPTWSEVIRAQQQQQNQHQQKQQHKQQVKTKSVSFSDVRDRAYDY